MHDLIAATPRPAMTPRMPSVVDAAGAAERDERGAVWVCTLPLRTTSIDAKVLRGRFEAARQIYNASLGEALRRLERARRSPLYREAVALRSAAASGAGAHGAFVSGAAPVVATGTARAGGPWTAMFRAALAGAEFSEFGIGTYALRLRTPRCGCARGRGAPPTICPQCGFVAVTTWIADHLGAHTVQRMGVRAFRTARRLALGEGRKARVLRYGEVAAVDGGSGGREIGFRADDVIATWRVPGRTDLALRAIVDASDRVTARAFAAPLRHARVVRRRLRGRELWYVQLVVAGEPLDKHPGHARAGRLAVVVQPCRVAVLHEGGATLASLCDGIAELERKIRALHRRMDRQRRAGTPENFTVAGRMKARAHLGPWRDSRRYLASLDRLRELERRAGETRRTLLGTLANTVGRLGDDLVVQTEIVAGLRGRDAVMQRRSAAGRFAAALERKVVAHGGAVEHMAVSSRSAPPLTCHSCGRLWSRRAAARAILAPRVFDCACGISMQEDLYRAFLAWCSPGGTFDVALAGARWEAASAHMYAAWRQLDHSVPSTATAVTSPAS